jgi:hypothetical protein
MMHINTKIKCIKNELKRRKKCYPMIVENGKMDQEYADQEIEIMSQVLQTLTQLKGMIL